MKLVHSGQVKVWNHFKHYNISQRGVRVQHIARHIAHPRLQATSSHTYLTAQIFWNQLEEILCHLYRGEGEEERGEKGGGRGEGKGGGKGERWKREG